MFTLYKSGSITKPIDYSFEKKIIIEPGYPYNVELTAYTIYSDGKRIMRIDSHFPPLATCLNICVEKFKNVTIFIQYEWEEREGVLDEFLIDPLVNIVESYLGDDLGVAILTRRDPLEMFVITPMFSSLLPIQESVVYMVDEETITIHPYGHRQFIISDYPINQKKWKNNIYDITQKQKHKNKNIFIDFGTHIKGIIVYTWVRYVNTMHNNWFG